mgnify:CR=1 FL=1
MARGRPTTYSPDVALEICTQIAQGAPLTRICKSENMPDVATVYRWLLAHPDFCEIYTRAREDQADTLADEIIDIADGSAGENMAGVQSANLRVDARKWVAAKLKPRKYSERHFQEVTGKDGAPVELSHTFLTPMPIEDIDEWAKAHQKNPE